MTTKRPSLKERAFEKLGFGQRFRSNTDVSDPGHSAEDDHSRTVWYTPSMDSESYEDITAPLTKPILSTAPVTGISSANVAPGVTTPIQIVESEGDSQSTSQPTAKHKRNKPDGTWEYYVKDSDTLESIAAFWDTTPSELKKLNKLTSRLIFPGQVLFVPDLEKPEKGVEAPPPRAKSPDRPSLKMDIPIVQMADKPLTKVPGHAERQTPVSSPKQEVEFEVPHKLTEDEAKELDQECYERFIKVNVKHITDGQVFELDHKLVKLPLGVVSGVLLVTPNAVMFDPNVSDPLVLEHGAERYGVIAPMDMIVSAALYHDIAAMGNHNANLSPTKPKPEVYHDRSCPLYRSWCEGHGAQFISQDPQVTDAHQPSRSTTMNSLLSEAESMCSCGVGAEPTDKSPMQNDRSPIRADRSPKLIDKCSFPINKSPVGNDKLLTQEEKIQIENNAMRPYSNSMDEFGEFQSAESSGEREVTHTSKIDSKNNTVLDELHGGLGHRDNDSLTTGISSGNVISEDVQKHTDSADVKDNDFLSHVAGESSQDNSDIKETVTSSQSETNSQTVDSSASDLKSSDQKTLFYLGESEVSVSENTRKAETNTEEGSEPVQSNGEMRIGNIVYLPVSENDKADSSVQAMETLSKLSLDQFDKHEGPESTPVEIPGVTDKGGDPRLSNSFGSFNMSPHLSAFVNYATGLFRAGSDVKDITDVIHVEEEEDGKPVDVTSKTVSEPNFRGVENAITLADKPGLFQSFDELIPRPAVASEDLPLYLCLRLGMPVNKEVSQTCPIQAYSKGRKKPEYWFSIPRDKVDHLYAFFVQWTPEIYGGDEDSAEKRGFVVLEDNNDSDEEKLEILDEYFSNGMAALHKDWEIISADEAIKRKSICEEESMILPELIGQSSILEEGLIYLINRFLPPRTIGYPWTLVYSTDRHGFSLRTLYRDMHGIDSPILLVVKDTENNVFGALTSCAFKLSEHFYGTGESFLFTFCPEFKVFRWTGENNFFIKGNQESLSIGAGQGKFGLWFDEDLYHGRTNRCETYDNDLLSDSEDFVVKTLEAWAFTMD